MAKVKTKKRVAPPSVPKPKVESHDTVTFIVGFLGKDDTDPVFLMSESVVGDKTFSTLFNGKINSNETKTETLTRLVKEYIHLPMKTVEAIQIYEDVNVDINSDAKDSCYCILFNSELSLDNMNLGSKYSIGKIGEIANKLKTMPTDIKTHLLISVLNKI